MLIDGLQTWGLLLDYFDVFISCLDSYYSTYYYSTQILIIACITFPQMHLALAACLKLPCSAHDCYSFKWLHQSWSRMHQNISSSQLAA